MKSIFLNNRLLTFTPEKDHPGVYWAIYAVYHTPSNPCADDLKEQVEDLITMQLWNMQHGINLTCETMQNEEEPETIDIVWKIFLTWEMYEIIVNESQS